VDIRSRRQQDRIVAAADSKEEVAGHHSSTLSNWEQSNEGRNSTTGFCRPLINQNC
jgi:hypothetical protein